MVSRDIRRAARCAHNAPDIGKRAFGPLEAVEKVRQPPEGHQTHHPRDARGMLFGFPQYPFPAKKQAILRTAHTKSAVFFCQGVGIPGTCPGIQTLFSLPNFQQEVYRQAESGPSARFLAAYTPPLRISMLWAAICLFFGGFRRSDACRCGARAARNRCGGCRARRCAPWRRPAPRSRPR